MDNLKLHWFIKYLECRENCFGPTNLQCTVNRLNTVKNDKTYLSSKIEKLNKCNMFYIVATLFITGFAAKSWSKDVHQYRHFK